MRIYKASDGSLVIVGDAPGSKESSTSSEAGSRPASPATPYAKWVIEEASLRRAYRYRFTREAAFVLRRVDV